MDLLKLFQGFVHGWRGMLHAVQTEQNMRIHCLAGVVAIAAGWFFQIDTTEWIAIVLCVGSVISLECVNTAVERLADRISTESDPLIKQAKDTASAAVQVAAITSVVVAGVVFVPRIWIWIGSGG